MDEYKNPPCNSLIATLFIHGMTSEEKVGETSPFTGPVGSADTGGLENDEEASKVCFVRNPRVVTDINLAAREGEDCMSGALEGIEANLGGHADCRAEEASEGDSFVDIMSSRELDTGGGSPGFTIAAYRFVIVLRLC